MPTTKTALVTGATGYIGSHLSRHLAAEGWRVHAVVRGSSGSGRFPPEGVVPHAYEGTDADIQRIVEDTKPDVVFHLAADGPKTGPRNMVEANILVGVQILEALRAVGHGCFIHAGSWWQFADVNGPTNLYAASKSAFDSMASFYQEKHHLNVTTLVLFDVYGPGDWRQKLIPALMHWSPENGVFRATRGDQPIDFIHVDDVVDAFMHAATRMVNQETTERFYGVRTGRTKSPQELVRELNQLRSPPVDVRWGMIQDQIVPPDPDTIDLPSLPGWKPNVDLKTGLRAVIKADRGKERKET